MTAYDEDDVIKGYITYKRQDYPRASFIMKESVDVAEDDTITISGNYTSNGSTTSDKQIFDGRIDKADFKAAQHVEAISKAEEIDSVRPQGIYAGYVECVMGKMINDSIDNGDINHITCEETSTYDEVVPISDRTIGSKWNYDGSYAYDEIDEGYGDDDGDVISVATTTQNDPEATATFNLGAPSWTADVNCYIYQIDMCVRLYTQDSSPDALIIDVYTDQGWLGETEIEAPVGESNRTASWTDLNFTQDDFDTFYCKLEHDGAGLLRYIESVGVKVYWTYYPNLDVTNIKIEEVDFGSAQKSLKARLNWLALLATKTWYFDPDLEIYLEDGDIDSGEDFVSSDSIGQIDGTRDIKSYNKVILYGPYVGETRLTATVSEGDGDIIYKDTYSVPDMSQTDLDALATDILNEKKSNYYTLQIKRRDTSKGLLQVGEKIDISANDLKFSKSHRYIPNGSYIIDRIDYVIGKGEYQTSDYVLIDGLIFSLHDENQIERISYDVDERGDEIESLALSAGAGEANTGSNIGTDGVGVYDGKSGATLQFRNIAPASSKITVTENGDDIDIDVDESSFDLSGLIDISDDTNLTAGTNITLVDDTLNVDDVFLIKTNNLSDLNNVATALGNLSLDTELQNLSAAEIDYLEALYATDVTDTEFDYLDGVTSAIQTQLDAKLEDITGESLSDLSDINANLATVLISQDDTAASLSDATVDGEVVWSTADEAFYRWDNTATAWIQIGGGTTEYLVDDLYDVTITSVADNEVLAYDSGSSEWINQTAAEAGISEVGHDHNDIYYTESEVDALTWDASDIVSGTFADAIISETSVTQHEAALSITESQISDLDHDAVKIYGKAVDTDDTIADNDILVYDSADDEWKLEAKPASGSTPTLDDVCEQGATTDVASTFSAGLTVGNSIALDDYDEGVGYFTVYYVDDSDQIRIWAKSDGINDSAFTLKLYDGSAYKTVLTETHTADSDAHHSIPTLDSPYAFKVSDSSGQTISHATWTKITFNSEDIDDDGRWSNASNRYNVPKTGTYFFGAGLLSENVSWGAGTIFVITLRKNTSTDLMALCRREVEDNETKYFWINGSCLVDLTAGDYVELFTYHSRGNDTDLYDVPRYNYFYGFLVERELS